MRRARELFGPEFLLRRPLLEALEHEGGPAVLLIDEIDRADDEFEAFLLEFLADFAITIPELGTIVAAHRPLVILTSNRTRELHDALKRRCLYHWIDYPTPEREAEIVRTRLPGVPEEVAARVCGAVARLRERELYKLPGVGETITWARALLALDGDDVARRHARRRAEGPRGHRPRPPRPGARGCLTQPAGHAEVAQRLRGQRRRRADGAAARPTSAFVDALAGRSSDFAAARRAPLARRSRGSPRRCARTARASGSARCSRRSARWPPSTRPRARSRSTRCGPRCARRAPR